MVSPERNADDSLVVSGINADKTLRVIWESRADGYAAMILLKQSVTGKNISAAAVPHSKRASFTVFQWNMLPLALQHLPLILQVF